VPAMLTIFDAVFDGYCTHAPHYMRSLMLSQSLLHLTELTRFFRNRLRFLPQLTQGVSTKDF
jgi:hypothetical protein